MIYQKLCESSVRQLVSFVEKSQFFSYQSPEPWGFPWGFPEEVSRIQQALNLDFVVASDSESGSSSGASGPGAWRTYLIVGEW